MSTRKLVVGVLLASALAGIAVAAYLALQKKQEADEATDQIQDQLDALDPVVRAAVVSRLAASEVNEMRPHHRDAGE